MKDQLDVAWDELVAEERTVLKRVQVRVATAEDMGWFAAKMAAQHYLGWKDPVGERVAHVAEVEGRPLALLLWAAGSYHLRTRDEWIGWTPRQRRERLALVVNNSRFLILEEGCLPNLASRVLSLSVKRLNTDWEATYGHGVLLAETFVNGRRFRGTCYQASGWERLGDTAGFSRVSEDFYEHHGEPKQLWVRPLQPDARKLLTAPVLPEPWAQAERSVPAQTELVCAQMKSLYDVFAQHVKDPRARIGRYPLPGLLVVVFAATLCGVSQGQRDLAAFANKLTKPQRHALRFRRDLHTGDIPAPSETTFFRMLNAVAPLELERALLVAQEWLLGPPPADDDLVALDGKQPLSGRGTQVVSAFSVKSGRWLGSERVADKSNEVPAVRQLLSRLDVEGKTVAYDALHTNQETAIQVVRDCGADYLVTVKGNQPEIVKSLEQLYASRLCGAFSPSGSTDGGNESRPT
jgi:hypothetical protein